MQRVNEEAEVRPENLAVAVTCAQEAVQEEKRRGGGSGGGGGAGGGEKKEVNFTSCAPNV